MSSPEDDSRNETQTVDDNVFFMALPTSNLDAEYALYALGLSESQLISTDGDDIREGIIEGCLPYRGLESLLESRAFSCGYIKGFRIPVVI